MTTADVCPMHVYITKFQVPHCIFKDFKDLKSLHPRPPV